MAHNEVMVDMQHTQIGTCETAVEFGLLTRPVTARAIDHSVETLKRWEKVGRGPRPVRMGRRVYYRRAEIERWLIERERAPAPATSNGGAAT
jgi:predicted DNA-binding transcriptional regulator AlpA